MINFQTVITQIRQGKKIQAIKHIAAYRLTSYFRRLIRDYTSRDNPEATLKIGA